MAPRKRVCPGSKKVVALIKDSGTRKTDGGPDEKRQWPLRVYGKSCTGADTKQKTATLRAILIQDEHIRYSRSLLRVMSATKPSCGTIIALDSSDP